MKPALELALRRVVNGTRSLRRAQRRVEINAKRRARLRRIKHGMAKVRRHERMLAASVAELQRLEAAGVEGR